MSFQRNTTRRARPSPSHCPLASPAVSISAHSSSGRSGVSRRNSRRRRPTSTIRNIGPGGSRALRRPRCARWARIPTCGTHESSAGRAWWSGLAGRRSSRRCVRHSTGSERSGRRLRESLGSAGRSTIFCGIHDSSASLLPHLKERDPPFAVVSTGTWVILFAVGGDIDQLDPNRDTLANVSAFGDPVACARFMGGREFERLTGGDATTADRCGGCAHALGKDHGAADIRAGMRTVPTRQGTVDT